MIRTLEQNALYWAIIGEAARSLKVTTERLHEYIKTRILTDPRTLEVGSTANLTKEKFSNFLDEVKMLIENKKDSQMYENQNQNGYGQQGQYQPQNEPQNLFVGSCKMIQTNYGPLLKVSFTAQDLELMRQYLNQNGWVNLAINQRREIGMHGQTHSCKIDTWQPQQQPQYQQQYQPQYQQQPMQQQYRQAAPQQQPQYQQRPPARPQDGGYNSYQPVQRSATPPTYGGKPYQPQVNQAAPSMPPVPPEPEYQDPTSDATDPQEAVPMQHQFSREDIPQGGTR